MESDGSRVTFGRTQKVVMAKPPYPPVQGIRVNTWAMWCLRSTHVRLAEAVRTYTTPYLRPTKSVTFSLSLSFFYIFLKIHCQESRIEKGCFFFLSEKEIKFLAERVINRSEIKV